MRDYDSYAAARMPALRRSAYLLYGDWDQGDDLVQKVLTKLYVCWSRARRADNLDVFVHTMLVRRFLDERRTGWAFDTSAQDVAVHIASTLRTDVDVPVAMPYAAAAPPAPLRLVGSLLGHQADGTFDAHLLFSDRDDMTDPDTRIPRMLDVSVTANSSLTGDGRGYPNRTVDGHPAVMDFDANSGHAMLLGVNGTWVDVYVYDPVTMTYVNEAAAVAMVQGIQVVANPGDASTWIASPLR